MPIVERRFILTKGPPWGFRLYLDNQDMLTISKIRRHSPAENAKLHSGDQIISINGKSIDGLSHAEAMILVDTTFGTLDILISRFESTSTKTLTFNKDDFQILDDKTMKTNLNLFRSEKHSVETKVPERTPEPVTIKTNLNQEKRETTPVEIKVPKSSPEPEIYQMKVLEESTPLDTMIRPSSPNVQPIKMSKLIKEYDVPDFSNEHILKKKNFADSSFYNDPYNLYPTAEEKIAMARRVASSLYAPDNKSSKGASIFEKQRKRADKYTLQKEETNVNGFASQEQKYDLAHWPEVLDHKEKSPSPMYRLGYSSGPPIPPPPPPPPIPNEAKTIQEFMEKVQKFPKAKHNNISPDVCFDIAASLHTSDSRGAQIFAKQKQRAEKWTLSAPETVTPQPIFASSAGPSIRLNQPHSTEHQTKSKIVSISRHQNQSFKSDKTNESQNLATTARRPSLVIRRNSFQGPSEPPKVADKLSISTSSHMVTVPPSVEPSMPASNAKWKPVKFNIPQRA